MVSIVDLNLERVFEKEENPPALHSLFTLAENEVFHIDANEIEPRKNNENLTDLSAVISFATTSNGNESSSDNMEVSILNNYLLNPMDDVQNSISSQLMHEGEVEQLVSIQQEPDETAPLPSFYQAFPGRLFSVCSPVSEEIASQEEAIVSPCNTFMNL